MDVSEASVEVLLMLPLPLVETWMMLPTHDGEFLDPSEQRACGEALRALMRGALSVESDGRSDVPELVEFRFVPLERTRAESAAGDAPVSLWTGQVLAHLRFRSESSLSHASLRWALFNSAVLSAQTILRGDGTCTEHEFTGLRDQTDDAPTGRSGSDCPASGTPWHSVRPSEPELGDPMFR